MPPALTCLVAAGLWLLWGAASSLADDRPVPAPSGLDTLDVIPYRLLTRDDFRGDHAPAEFLAAAGGLVPVAVSCAYLTVSPRAQVYAVPVPTAQGRRYEARFRWVTFHAVLSRTCSWWNDGHEVSPAYVLEHEQIHFALFEIAARRLNREVPRLIRTFAFESEDPRQVVDQARGHLRRALSAALKETAVLHQKLDLQTSFGFQPLRQETWRRRVEADLAQLAPYAAPPEDLLPLPARP